MAHSRGAKAKADRFAKRLAIATESWLLLKLALPWRRAQLLARERAFPISPEATQRALGFLARGVDIAEVARVLEAEAQ